MWRKLAKLARSKYDHIPNELLLHKNIMRISKNFMYAFQNREEYGYHNEDAKKIALEAKLT